jgi:probable F420-dependent oxidoreductase
VPELCSWAVLAEEAGFESMWITELYDRSALIPIAAMAAATKRIILGSGIAYAFGRTPLVLAAEARDLDLISGGRFILGLGVGTKRMQQDWHGLDGEHPAPKLEELLPLVRRLWRVHEEPVHHDGRFYRMHLEPTAPPAVPLRARIPVYLAGVNRRMVEAAGAVADGLVGHPLFTPEYVETHVRPALARGAERAGRAEPPPIAGYLMCSADQDRDLARQRAAAQISFYSVVKTYEPIMRLHGFTDVVSEIRTAWRAGDHKAMAAAVPAEMIDAIAIAGTPQECRARFAERWAGVYERPLLYPPTFGGSADVPTLIKTFA